MALFQTRPETVEAIQFTGFDDSGQPTFSEHPEWLPYFTDLQPTHTSSIFCPIENSQYILAGHRVLPVGGWIIFDRREHKITAVPNYEFSAKYRQMETPAS